MLTLIQRGAAPDFVGLQMLKDFDRLAHAGSASPHGSSCGTRLVCPRFGRGRPRSMGGPSPRRRGSPTTPQPPCSRRRSADRNRSHRRLLLNGSEHRKEVPSDHSLFLQRLPVWQRIQNTRLLNPIVPLSTYAVHWPALPAFQVGRASCLDSPSKISYNPALARRSTFPVRLNVQARRPGTEFDFFRKAELLINIHRTRPSTLPKKLNV